MAELPCASVTRQKVLARRRDCKMARSLYHYLRGDVDRFYQHLGDLSHLLPQGPMIWISGDCHFGNLGPLSDGKGAVQVRLRDFDQAVVGNPAIDLLRLALSLASVVTGRRAGEQILHVVAATLRGYAIGVASGSDATMQSGDIKVVRRRAAARGWRHIVRERLGKAAPELVLGKRFWPLLTQERRDLERLVAAPALAADLFDEAARYKLELIDAAYWVKGCSSLGGLRFAITVRRGEQFHLLDVKEAVTPWDQLRNSVDPVMDEADRVVAGARALSPRLGMRMHASRLDGRPVFTRVLAPEDGKLESDLMQGSGAWAIARHLGAVVGRSHGDQLALADRRAWARAVTPGMAAGGSWLFDAVATLLGRFEADYLRHCRQTAMDANQAR